MFALIEAHPLLTALVSAAIIGVIGYVFRRLFDTKPSGKNQTVKQSNVGRDLQQADVIFNQPSFQNFSPPERNKSFAKIPLNPSIKEVSEVMNGGRSSRYVKFQVRLKTESDLELKEAYLVYREKKIHCVPRERKLNQVTNNILLFDPQDLPFIPDVIFHLRIKVCDYYDHCCELTHELQMKHFLHKDFSGKNSGRWEIHPIGIFKIRNCEASTVDNKDKEESDRVSKKLQEPVDDPYKTTLKPPDNTEYYRSILSELTRDEKEYLHEFIEKDVSTVQRHISDGVSQSLIAKGVVVRPGQISHEHEINYLLQPWARRMLKKNPDYLK